MWPGTAKAIWRDADQRVRKDGRTYGNRAQAEARSAPEKADDQTGRISGDPGGVLGHSGGLFVPETHGNTARSADYVPGLSEHIRAPSEHAANMRLTYAALFPSTVRKSSTGTCTATEGESTSAGDLDAEADVGDDEPGFVGGDEIDGRGLALGLSGGAQAASSAPAGR
jgi:hypothetical protein